MKNRIGIGIITCNREGFFKVCIESIPNADLIIVVNDGKPYEDKSYPDKVDEIIQHKKNLGVGVSKNDALKLMLKKGCEHLFLCEDDIKITDAKIYQLYIQASLISGIQHFNYAYHGPGNRNDKYEPISKKTIEYANGVKVSLNHNLLGAFSYFSRTALQKVGLIDQRYHNAWEHVDHTYQIIKSGMHPPFWWFADIENSYNYIKDLHDLHSQSVIRKNKVIWKLKLRYNSFLFKIKNGNYPASIPELNEIKVLNELKTIQNKYGQKY